MPEEYKPQVIQPDTEEQKQEEERVKEGDPIPPSAAGTEDVNYISLKGYFHIDDGEAQDPDTKDKLNYIFKTVSKAINSEDRGNVLLTIRQLEQKLSAPPMGVSRV